MLHLHDCFNVSYTQQAIREGAVEALRACLVILAQRETKEMQKRPIWYNVSLKNLLYIKQCNFKVRT